MAPVAALTELIARLDDLLQPERFDDYGPNGLQVPGREEVGRRRDGRLGRPRAVRARDRGGRRPRPRPPRPLLEEPAARASTGPAKARLQLLFDHDVSLAAYHLPLDAHLEHGNNALLAAALGAELIAPFPAARAGTPIGVVAHLPGDGLAPAELRSRTTAAVGGREPLAFLAGPDRIRTVGIVSGGGSPYLRDAIAEGLDAFLTGEPTECVMLLAQEHGIHFLAAGHYATETLGVRRLGELLAAEFGVEHTFIDVPNPI